MPKLKSFFIPIAIGALSAFGFAPFSFPPALIASYAWLFYQLLKIDNTKQAFGLSYLWALGHYVAGLYWIGNSTLIDWQSWWWAYPLASFALPAAFSLYQAVAGALSVHLAKHGFNKLVLLLITFPLCELARAYWFTGFPWNMAGVTWISIPWIAQNADYMGMYGLGILTFLCAGAVANYKEKTGLIACVFIIAIMSLYGAAVRKPTSYDESTTVRIVQPNVAQKTKWDQDHIYANSMAPLILSDVPPKSKTPNNIIIWPETAQAKDIWRDPEFKKLYRATLADWPKGTVIYTGLLQTDPGDLANAIVAADIKGNILWQQNKHHLVPYGEYMPYDEILNIGPIVGMEGFNKGNPPRAMDDGVIPLICYEIIFPDLAQKARTAHARMIITTTDDSWFGISSGPYQHLVQAQFRAIETGLPVLRSANTGISGVIDSFGRIIHKTSLEKYDFIESALPQPRNIPPRAALPQKIFLLLYLGLAVFFCVVRRFYKIF